MENYVTEGAISALLIAAAVGYGVAKYTVTGDTSTNSSTTAPKTSSGLPGSFGELDASLIEQKPAPSKKKKAAKSSKATPATTTQPPQPQPSPTPAAPIKESPPQPEPKKAKKKAKKAKSASTTLPATPAPPSTGPSEVGQTTEDEGEWTTVESSQIKHKKSKAPEPVPELPPVVEPTVEEPPRAPVNQKTLAEKMLPKPRKTGVEDMVETPDYPTVARVMRIVDPAEQSSEPAPVPIAPQPLDASMSESTMAWLDQPSETLNDDDEGWESIPIKSKGKAKASTSGFSSTASNAAPRKQTTTETVSKKARQNAARREREKADKAAAEQERLATLAKHKKNLEKVRMDEQWNQTRGKGKVSGGMQAAVDSDGRLVWE